MFWYASPRTLIITYTTYRGLAWGYMTQHGIDKSAHGHWSKLIGPSAAARPDTLIGIFPTSLQYGAVIYPIFGDITEERIVFICPYGWTEPIGGMEHFWSAIFVGLIALSALPPPSHVPVPTPRPVYIIILYSSCITALTITFILSSLRVSSPCTPAYTHLLIRLQASLAQ